jgi:hypothetical protein
MIVHRHVFPTTKTTMPNVFVYRTQAMNPSTCLYHHGINHLLCNMYQNR